MKKGIVVVVALVVLCLPCGGCFEFVSGVGTGAALEQIATQAERDLAENIALVQMKTGELEGLLLLAENEEDRAALRLAIEDGKRLIDKMQDALLAAQLTRQGVKTDWKNPEAIGTFVAAAVAAVMAFMARAKQKKADTAEKKYQAHKQGTERVKLANPDIAEEIYTTIGEERAALGI